MSEKKTFRLGNSDIPVEDAVRDPRGIEDIIIEAMEADFQAARYTTFDQRLFPFADAADLAEWDSFLIGRYPPLYTGSPGSCSDCPLGPCDLKAGNGLCGLTGVASQARQSLRRTCQGCLSQFLDSRELLNYALKIYGPDHSVEWGKMHDRSDTSHIGLMTAMWPKNLADLNRVLSYAEEQLNKLFAASFTGLDPLETEQMVLHTGSILLAAMNVSELVKMNCFGFTNASNEDIMTTINWPPANILGGLGNVEPGKPALTFLGDNFLPGFCAVKQLQEENLSEKVEICGIGPAGHDIIRFYDRCRILGPMTQARKLVRHGISDVIVAGDACIDLSFLGDAKIAGTKVIWTSRAKNIGLPDYSDETVEKIVADLLAGAPGAWVRHTEKAAAAAVKLVQKISRPKSHLLSEEAVKKEAKRCREDCDRCSNVCPNGLLIGQQLRKVNAVGIAALKDIEEGCYLCGACEKVCPEKIPLENIIVAALDAWKDDDKLKMRAGRGPVARVETTAWAFGSMWGNCPGIFHILGCGDTRSREELGWIAYNLTWRNAIVFTAGCGAGEIGRYFNKEKGQYVYEQFGTEAQLRNLINCGSCTACSHIVDQALKWPRTGSGVAHYANFAETADIEFNIIAPTLIVWGALPDRMHALVASWVRAGMSAVIGPNSGFEWNRYLMGNKWKWEEWWSYMGYGGEKQYHEPSPSAMIIPVETKEEAITQALAISLRPVDIRDARQTRLDTWIELSEQFFQEFPDDWQLFARSDWELPIRYKSRLLRELREKHGWDIDRLHVKRAKHPDGRLLEMGEFSKEYSAMTKAITKLKRMIARGSAPGGKEEKR